MTKKDLRRFATKKDVRRCFVDIKRHFDVIARRLEKKIQKIADSVSQIAAIQLHVVHHDKVLDEHEAGADRDRMARLVRQGILRPPTSTVPAKTLGTAPPKSKRRVSLSRLVIDERRNSR